MTAILATKLRSCVQLSCHDAEASRRRVRRSERSTSIPNNVGGELPRKCKGRPRKPLAEVILKCAPLRATSSGKNTMRSGSHSQEQNSGWPNPGLPGVWRKTQNQAVFARSQVTRNETTVGPI